MDKNTQGIRPIANCNHGQILITNCERGGGGFKLFIGKWEHSTDERWWLYPFIRTNIERELVQLHALWQLICQLGSN